MRTAAGITVALAMYWLAGAVGAASLPPDDQYSPQPSPYRRDVARGPRGYPNWLHYTDPSETKPGVTTRKDSVIQSPDLLASSPRRWSSVATGNNLTERARSNIDVPEEISSASREDLFVADDTFQDQGPGSVEVYKLDLVRENSLLVPESKNKQQTRNKSKIPKKALAEELLWKLKPTEPSKSLLPAIFRQPSSVLQRVVSTLPRERSRKMDEVLAVGGVPELQVGCEGLEASDRQRRSSDHPADKASDDNSENWRSFKVPVYKESTEPILSRVTPIVLDFDEEPPSGEVYEEMDELLKLKNHESTSTAPTSRRRNRADIDPALTIHNHEDLINVETFPERGDLGPVTNDSSKFKRSISPKGSQENVAESAKSRDDDTLSTIAASRSESSRHQGEAGRKLLWLQYPERQDNQARNRHPDAVNERRRNEADDLWGFGEDDGVISGPEDESDAEELRKMEMEKRRREYERRRHEELERRRVAHRPNGQEHDSRKNDANAEIERIRKEYEMQLEKEQRERQRIGNGRRIEPSRRTWEEDRRRAEEAIRRREEDLVRRMDEQGERNNQEPPEALTRPEHDRRTDNRSSEDEERKLREYIERNRPIVPTSHENRRRPEEQQQPPSSRGRNDSEERRRHMEEETRRQQVEEQRRRQHQEKEDATRRRTEEHRRREQQRIEEERRREIEENHRRRQQHSDDYERRREMNEQRRRQQPNEEETERRRQESRATEEERKLQDYVRRNQPINVPRRNKSEIFTEEQRRTLEAARQYERNKVMPSRTHQGRSHGPSAPTNDGQRTESRTDLEEVRRRHEAESERRRIAAEERRREEEYRRVESRRHEEERMRLEAMRRAEENRGSQSEPRRGSSWQDSASSRRPTNIPRRGSADEQVRDREAEELRRQEAAVRTADNSMRNQENEWKRRSDERDRQREEQEERERVRIENERNSRNNGRRRPHHENTGFKENRHRQGESVRSLEEKRRREHARLSSLPVSARIILRPHNGSRSTAMERGSSATPPTPLIATRGNFDNDIDFPAINPNRPGLAAARFPAPPTRRPPAKSPGACVWAIVQCCPANNRLTTCFESMGCPGGIWDSSPCRGSLADAARAEVVRFYAAAEDERTRF